jgi:hypothetical protein
MLHKRLQGPPAELRRRIGSPLRLDKQLSPLYRTTKSAALAFDIHPPVLFLVSEHDARRQRAITARSRIAQHRGLSATGESS